MGPIWDFDWAYDYEGKETHFGSYETPLFSDDMNGVGTAFFPTLPTRQSGENYL